VPSCFFKWFLVSTSFYITLIDTLGGQPLLDHCIIYALCITVWRYVFVADIKALSRETTQKFIRFRNAEICTIPVIKIYRLFWHTPVSLRAIPNIKFTNKIMIYKQKLVKSWNIYTQIQLKRCYFQRYCLQKRLLFSLRKVYSC